MLTTILVTAGATVVVLGVLAFVVVRRLRVVVDEVEQIVATVVPEVERLQEAAELASSEWERISTTPIRE